MLQECIKLAFLCRYRTSRTEGSGEGRLKTEGRKRTVSSFDLVELERETYAEDLLGFCVTARSSRKFQYLSCARSLWVPLLLVLPVAERKSFKWHTKHDVNKCVEWQRKCLSCETFVRVTLQLGLSSTQGDEEAKREKVFLLFTSAYVIFKGLLSLCLYLSLPPSYALGIMFDFRLLHV